MRPLYIFDLDGTLALIEHRRHFVEGENKDWPAFFQACVDDTPNEAVINIMRELYRSGQVWIFSGRSDEVRIKTEDWLERYDIPYTFLQMRKEGDYTPDEVLKKKWLDEMHSDFRRVLVCVFDDRDKVVKMWRDNGITCLQVAPGGF